MNLMKHQTATSELDAIQAREFHPRTIDDDPALLEQSYRLRYQVYCVERDYLNAARLSRPAGDRRVRRRLGARRRGRLVTASWPGPPGSIKPNGRGLPMFRPLRALPGGADARPAGHRRRRSLARVDQPRVRRARREQAPKVEARSERQRGKEPFLTLVKAIMQGAKRAGATHLIGATDAAFHRWLVHYGLPYRFVRTGGGLLRPRGAVHHEPARAR